MHCNPTHRHFKSSWPSIKFRQLIVIQVECSLTFSEKTKANNSNSNLSNFYYKRSVLVDIWHIVNEIPKLIMVLQYLRLEMTMPVKHQYF